MITNKDIRVENGSLILNGDPYPLDGQSPEAIMQIVKDNSDTTPTENSNNPVKSGGIFSTISQLNNEIAEINGGATAVVNKQITANDENNFLLAVFANIATDMVNVSHISRIFTWNGHNTYAVDAYLVGTDAIYATMYSNSVMYVIMYNKTAGTVSKKTVTLT